VGSCGRIGEEMVLMEEDQRREEKRSAGAVNTSGG
jgi:hypothetical protein